MGIYDFGADTTRSRLRRLESSGIYKRRSSRVTSSGPYSVVSEAAVDSSGSVNLSGSGVSYAGAVSPSTISGQFSYVATDTTVAWYWDGTNGSSPLLLNRTDGTRFAVPSSSITVVGLLPSTTYTFLPFWPVNGSAVGWAIGDSGTPSIAFAGTPGALPLSQQNQKDRESLGTIQAVTNASGSTGGTQNYPGGAPVDAGGSGQCVLIGTEIEPLGNGRLSQIELPHSRWVRIVTEDGLTLTATPDHPVYTDHGKTQLFKVRVGEQVITRSGMQTVIHSEIFTRIDKKLAVSMTKGHLFWANGILSHNVKITEIV